MRIPLLHNCYFSIGGSIVIASLDLSSRGSNAAWPAFLALAWFVMYAAYCLQNYATCREPHCAITGPGFLIAAAVKALLIAGIVIVSRQVPWLIFVVAAAVGFGYEWLVNTRKVGN